MVLPIKQIIKMENNKEMGEWLNDFNLPHPQVIAGPCSAETEATAMAIAHTLT